MSKLGIAPSQDFIRLGEDSSGLDKLHKGFRCSCHDLILILYDNLGFRKKGSVPGFEQFTAIQLATLPKELLQLWGIYPTPDNPHTLSRVRKCWEDERANVSFDDIMGIKEEDNNQLAKSIISGIETIIGNLPKQKTFIVSSIFGSGLADFDNNIIFLNLETLEEFSNLSEKDRNLEIYLKNPQKISNQKDIVKKIFSNDLVFTWADMNKSLFSALKVERNVMFIILSLIIIVAAFNIISGLTILVKNKTKDIAILKSIGVLNNSIIKIFFLIGVIIGTSATLFGILLGVTFSIYVENIRDFISTTFDLTLFPEEIYFLSTLPSEINISSILLISICSIFMTILVSIFPAMKAAKLDPIKSLKYE